MLFFVQYGSSQVDLTKADNLFLQSLNPVECRDYLESVLPEAHSGKEKAEVLCRLSKTYLILGQNESSRDKKRELFGKGVSYAEQAIREDSTNPECYMWHSGNVGRECQTRSITEQIKKLSVIMDDLTMILDKMKMTEYSAAWQAMAEIYMNHPMKSNDEAISFARKAVMTIPEGEIRITAYTLLARLMHDRDWSASKRASAIAKSAEKFKAKYSSVTDKYAYFEGSLGTGYKPAWSTRSIGEMTDREEAEAIVAYVRKLYGSAQSKSEHDKADFKELTALAGKW